MNVKTGTIWRKAVAAALALTVVAGGVPAQIFPGVFADNAIVASADAASMADLQSAVSNGGKITLTKDYQATLSSGGAQYLEITKDVTIDLNGHSLIGRDNVVIRVSSGTLTITDSTNGSGKITGGTKYGAVEVTGGAFILESGTITGNNAVASNGEYNAAGVTVRSGAVFTMTGGSITRNSSATGAGSCGGVKVVGGTFNFKGGEISYNEADESSSPNKWSCGGILIISQNGSSTKGVLNMTGGKVIGNVARANNAKCIGGIFCMNGEAHISGGSITMNENHSQTGYGSSGAGISALSTGTIYMKGEVEVSGNKKNSKDTESGYIASDVFVEWENDAAICVEGSLAGSHIGLDTSQVDGYVITEGFKDSSVGDIFFPDEPIKGEKAVKVSVLTEGTYKGEITVDYNEGLAVGKVEVAQAAHCTVIPVSPADFSQVAAGTKVEFTVKTDAGYVPVKPVVRMVGGSSVSVSEYKRDGVTYYSFTMPTTDATITPQAVEAKYSLISHQVVLDGDIGLVYIMNIKDSAAASSAVMEFDVDGETRTASGVKSGDYYKFVCPTTSKEMSVNIKAALKNGSEVLWSDTDGYSVKKYTDQYFADSSLQTTRNTNIIKAMLNYGAAAQEYFGFNTNDLANGGKFPNDAIAWAGTAGYPGSPVSEIKFSGVSLDLKSSLRLNTYFTGADSLSVSDVEGAEVFNVDGKKMISIPIKPWELSREFTITATKGTEKVEFKYKPEYYCYNVFNKPEKFKNERNFDGLKKVIYYLNVFGNTAKNS